jgi:uncharacterized paraquat-inducible protein A
MRDPVPNAALPRAPDHRREEGRDVAPREDGVRCPNPKCRKKLAEELHGSVTITCPRCGHYVTIFHD